MCLHRAGMFRALRQLDLSLGALLIIIQFFARHVAALTPTGDRPGKEEAGRKDRGGKTKIACSAFLQLTRL